MKGMCAYCQCSSNDGGHAGNGGTTKPGGLPGGGGIWEDVRLRRSQQVKQEAEIEPACALFSKVVQEEEHLCAQEWPPVHGRTPSLGGWES